MIRKLILTTVLMLSVFTIVSCGSKKKTESDSNTPPVTDSSSSSSTNTESNKNDDDKKNETENKSETESKPQSNAKDTDSKIKFSIYKIDENSLEPNEVSSISLDLSLIHI